MCEGMLTVNNTAGLSDSTVNTGRVLNAAPRPLACLERSTAASPPGRLWIGRTTRTREKMGDDLGDEWWNHGGNSGTFLLTVVTWNFL